MRLQVLISTVLFVGIVSIVVVVSLIAPTGLDLDHHPMRLASSIELISLDPYERPNDDPTRFHRWKVLGSTMIHDSTVREQLLDSLSNAMKDHDDSSAMCFNPRHGIRGQVNGHTYEFVICFECLQGKWYIDGTEQIGFLLNAKPTDLFNAILSERNVELPKPTHLVD